MALVVEGEIVLGVMGCPNWQEEYSGKFTSNIQEYNNTATRSGVIMISHVGRGTWRKQLWNAQIGDVRMPQNWIRCFVDGHHLIHGARFCIPESQTWESMPLSSQFNATTDAECVEEKQVLLVQTCCGRFSLVQRERNSLLFAFT